MKLTPIWLGGSGGLALFGLVAFAVVFFQLGWPDPVELPETSGKPLVAEFKKKTEDFNSIGIQSCNSS